MRSLQRYKGGRTFIIVIVKNLFLNVGVISKIKSSYSNMSKMALSIKIIEIIYR